MSFLLFLSNTRFVPDKEFSGADHGQRREGPVQFEEDPFGLDKFLEEAKQHGGSKRPSTSSRSKDDYHDKKRRKEWARPGSAAAVLEDVEVVCALSMVDWRF